MDRYNPDKRCIFRQVFNSQSDIDENPYGKVTYQGPTLRIENGILKLNYAGGSSGMFFNVKTQFKNATIRIKMKVNRLTGGNQYIFTNNSNYIIGPAGTIASQNNPYINGKYDMDSKVDEWAEYVLYRTSTSLNNSIILFCASNKYGNLDADIEFVEIYNTQLSASEIKNLYENKTIQPFTDSLEMFHLNAYNGIINDKMGKVVKNLDPNKIKVDKYNGIKNSIIHLNNLGYEAIRYVGSMFYPTEQSYSFWIAFNEKKNAFNTNGRIVTQSDGNNYLQIRLSSFVLECFGVNLGYTVLFDSKYRHYVITKTNNGVTKLYVNGVLISTSAPSTPIYYYGYLDFFNRYANHGYAGVTSAIINFRIFNNLLNSFEVNSIYTSEKKLFNIK